MVTIRLESTKTHLYRAIRRERIRGSLTKVSVTKLGGLIFDSRNRQIRHITTRVIIDVSDVYRLVEWMMRRAAYYLPAAAAARRMPRRCSYLRQNNNYHSLPNILSDHSLQSYLMLFISRAKQQWTTEELNK